MAVSINGTTGISTPAITGMTTPLTVAQGGTGATSNAGTAFALKGANSDITSITGLTTALTIAQGGIGATTLAAANIPVTNAATSYTATQTFTGSTSVLAAIFANAAETTTIAASAATGTLNYDVTTQSVWYYTSNASANFTMNFRGSSGTSLNTAMATGQTVTVVFLCTNGSTAYYNNAVTVDGASVTPKYQGGTAWSSGNASGIDAYSYTIIKTGSAAFTVLAAQTQFK